MPTKKQYNNQDRDDGVRGELLKQQDNEAQMSKLDGMSKKVIDTSDRPAAKSQWSTGRGCPKCKHTLAIKEMTKNGALVVFCHTCGSEYFAADLESTSEIGDKIHRQIPDDLVLRYMMANDLRLKMQGK